MKMKGKGFKRSVQIALVILFVVDTGLAVERWRMGVTSSVEQLQLQTVRLRAEVAALESNLHHAQTVKRNIPHIALESNRFYRQELLNESDGYSALLADFDKIAHEAGLQTSGVRFQQKAASKQGVTEVVATAVIEGSYSGLIRFINGLERSRNFYVLDSLQLASSTGGKVKLNIQLHTYFRT